MVISEPDRFDRNRNRSGILIFIGEDIPSQLLVDHKLPHDTEGIFVELNLRKESGYFFG